MSYWKNRKVLVTGGAGFIGSYLTELLVAEGSRVTVADDLSRGGRDRIRGLLEKIRLVTADLRNPLDCLKACRGQDTVFNLAAKVTGIEYNRFHMADMFQTNMALQMNVLQAAATSKVPHFLQVSTACIYPHDAPVPTPESAGEKSSPEPTNEGYGFAKLMGEKMAQYTHRETGMHATIARPFNAYGPRDHFDEATSHVIPALMKRILDGDNPVDVWGSGDQSRAFVHAKDIARGMMLVAEKAPAATPVNIGHDGEVTIKQLFALICKTVGMTPEARYDTSKPDGYARRAADTTLLKRLTGFVPSVTLEEGLREMHAWFLTQRKHTRISPKK